MFWKNDDGDDVFFLSREEARKRKKKWKEKRGERRTEFGRVSCNESLSLENALAFLLLDEPKMRERGTEMARARKRKKGREGVGRDAIEFFFFFLAKGCVLGTHFETSNPFLSFKRHTLHSLPSVRWLRAPASERQGVRLLAHKKGPREERKKAIQKELPFFPLFSPVFRA